MDESNGRVELGVRVINDGLGLLENMVESLSVIDKLDVPKDALKVKQEQIRRRIRIELSTNLSKFSNLTFQALVKARVLLDKMLDLAVDGLYFVVGAIVVQR